jgi:hypothetical protein
VTSWAEKLTEKKAEPLWISTKGRGREFAELVSHLAEELYPEAEKIRPMADKLNIHSAASFYQIFDAERTRELCRRTIWGSRRVASLR